MNTLTMIIISVVAGLLSTMNVWVVRADDMRLHINDFYMVVLMTSWMILLSSLYMYYGSSISSTNYHIHGTDYVSIILFSLASICASYYLIRNQTLVNDTQFLKGMIPHHSMAIHMAQRIESNTLNPQLKLLATNIIREQKREIELMKKLENNKLFEN